MQLKNFLFSLLLFPCSAMAQDITGLWTGYLSTTEKTLPYEVVISKQNGTLVAYSHTTFTVNGKEITSVKKLAAIYDMRHLTLQDEDLLKNNFDKSAPKKISQTTELDLRMNGKEMVLEGSFKTKRTRTLRPAEGVIVLYKSPDPLNAQARIQQDLLELKLEDALLVFKPVPPPDIAINEPVKQPLPAKTEVAALTTPVKTAPVVVAAKPEATAKTPVPAAPGKTAPVTAAAKPAVTTKAPEKKEPVTTAAKASVAANKPPVPKPAAPPVVSTAPATKPVAPAPVTTAPVVAAAPKPALPTFAAIDLGKRKIEVIDNITVFSDSLVFSIYDNGEVDGDTVSVILNGKTILSKQRLSTRALTQTIHLTPELGDTLQIIMYAENMGLYPPNTGLLIIQDGTRRREVRFSGDLNKNAALMLHRYKP